MLARSRDLARPAVAGSGRPRLFYRNVAMARHATAGTDSHACCASAAKRGTSARYAARLASSCCLGNPTNENRGGSTTGVSATIRRSPVRERQLLRDAGCQRLLGRVLTPADDELAGGPDGTAAVLS